MDPRTWPNTAYPSTPTAAHLQSTPHKRAYIPSTHSLVSDIKKRRLMNGVEGIQPGITQTPRGRQGLMGGSSGLLSVYSPGGTLRSASCFHTPQKPAFSSDSFSREEAELLEISKRPKFKAKPVPRTQYQPSIVIKASDKPLTVPVDLNVLTHSRSYSCASRESTDEVESSTSFKARNMPDFSSVNLPPKREFTPTQPQPFSLQTEERGREKVISLQYKLQVEGVNQLQAAQFTANPLPVFSPPKPILSTRPQTVPQPFNIRAPQASALPAFPAVNAFKARPMPDFSVPFQPTLPGSHTEPMDIELHSNIQAQHRALFEEQMREKQRREQQLAAVQMTEIQHREAAEIKQLRKQMEFRARPMPPQGEFVVRQSEKLLTVPEGPFLHTAMRAFNKSQCNENCNPNVSQTQSHASTICSEVSMSLCEEEAMDTGE